MAVDIAWVLVLALFVAVIWRLTGKRTGDGESGTALRPGAGTVGTIYDMLNEDKRNAVELIVEQKAAERRPEYPDGNLPDLETPVRPAKPGDQK
jgi:hypothetical protein